MLRLYIVYYRYKIAGEKGPGPIRHYRVYAKSLEEARQTAKQYANYPDIQILDIKPA